MACTGGAMSIRTRPAESSTPADASTLGRAPEAETLAVTAFNVGMIHEESFKSQQDAHVTELARYVQGWLEEGHGAAVVGLNEIHPTIFRKLLQALPERLDVHSITSGSDSLLWRAPQ